MTPQYAELLGLTTVSREAAREQARRRNPRLRIPRGRAAAAAQAAWDQP